MSATTARSSARVMATTTRPWGDWSSPRSCRNRTSTMVLATLTDAPTTRDCTSGQPKSDPTPTDSKLRAAMPTGAPTTATRPVRRSSRTEKSKPAENISSTTPMSANSWKASGSARVGPGVNGPMAMPPRM